MATFGSVKLLNGKEEVSSDTLKGKVVGIYFSAHWCPPCRGFTPVLAKWYKNFKANHAKKDDFEIVFCSSDRDEGAFSEYFKEMPWLALPYGERELKEKLSKKFKVQGIPSFVIVDGEGKLVTKNGRSIVTDDAEGAEFPWAPKPLSEILGADFVNNKGEKVSKDSFAGKHVGIYFSAHWCPPCRGFTPQLIKTYNKVVGDGKPFEMIFASSDRDQASFDEYFAEMPWLAIPLGDKRKEALSKTLEIQGIPSLVILDPEGNIVNAEGRAAVGGDPEGEEFPWKPKPLNELTGESASSLNDSTIVLAFTGGKKEDVDAAKAMLQPIAEKEEEVAKAAGDDQILFMYTDNDDSIDMVRDFAQLPQKSPLLVIMDIPHQCKYVAESHELTAENVEKFVADYKAGKLQDVPLK